MAKAALEKAPASGAQRPVTATPELTILMPCLNEAETIEVCVRKAMGYLAKSGVSGEVLIADNGSTDGSQAMAEALRGQGSLRHHGRRRRQL